MVIVDWQYKFEKQLEINKGLMKKNIELLRKEREGFFENFYWTKEYPKQAGWYWIKVGFDGFPGMENFWPDSKGKICAQDVEYNLYGEECFKDCWFSNRPIIEPEDM